jgi:RHS repeat-associated protein
MLAAAFRHSRLNERPRPRMHRGFSRTPKLADPRSRMAVSGPRYYSSSQGRFLGRDPIQEKGGLNLYGFCRNNPISIIDRLGQEWVWVDYASAGGEYVWVDDEPDVGTRSGNLVYAGGGEWVPYNQWQPGRDTWIGLGGSSAGGGVVYEGGSMRPFVVTPTTITPPSFSFTPSTLSAGQIASAIGGGVLSGAGDFAVGLGQSVVGGINGLHNLITDPIGTMNNTATAVGTAAVTLLTNPGVIVNGVSNTVNNAINTPTGAAAASQGIGNLTGAVLIGMALTPQNLAAPMRYGVDFVGPTPFPRNVTIDPVQLQKKFTKHAGDFGVTGPYNSANAAAFDRAIQTFIGDSGTQVMQGFFNRSQQSIIIHVNPQTGLSVMATQSGGFISGWKLNPQQLQHVLTTGKLGGG